MDKKVSDVIAAILVGIWCAGTMFMLSHTHNEPVEPKIMSSTHHIEVLESSTVPLVTYTPLVVSPAATNQSLEKPKPRYGFTDEDIYFLAQLLCGDAGYNGDGEYDFVWGALNGEMNYDEMSKVLCIVMNRVECTDGRFPNTVKEVLLQPGQFQDGSNLGKTPHPVAIEKITQWCEAYDSFDLSTQSIPETHYFYDGDGRANHTREVWR